MKLIEYINPKFVDTYEAYSSVIHIGNKCFVIPYINIDIMGENPISAKQARIDYSYYVFKGFKSIEFALSKCNLTIKTDIIADTLRKEHIGFGGYKTSDAGELKVMYL